MIIVSPTGCYTNGRIRMFITTRSTCDITITINNNNNNNRNNNNNNNNNINNLSPELLTNNLNSTAIWHSSNSNHPRLKCQILSSSTCKHFMISWTTKRGVSDWNVFCSSIYLLWVITTTVTITTTIVIIIIITTHNNNNKHRLTRHPNPNIRSVARRRPRNHVLEPPNWISEYVHH